MNHTSNINNHMMLSGGNTNNNNSSSNNSIMKNHNSNNSQNTLITTNVNNNNNSSSSSQNQNNNNNNVLTTSRGPVKNINTNNDNITNQQQQHNHILQLQLHQQQLQQQQKDDEETQQHHIDLLSASVKSELKSEDSDSKSQYEENVMQPLTPPESYCASDEKLLDEISIENDTITAIPIEEDMEEAIDKLNGKNSLINNVVIAKINNNSNNNNGKGNTSIAIEAYDLTTATTPPPSVTVVGRKARIGKTMAREMVYAGQQQQQQQQQQQHANFNFRSIAAAAQQQPQQEQHLLRTVQPTSQILQQQQHHHNNHHHQQQQQQHHHQHSHGIAITTAAAATQTQAQQQQQQQLLFVLKAEIKSEKIKLEDDLIATSSSGIISHSSILNNKNNSKHSQHINNNLPELKTIIKKEPLTDCELLSMKMPMPLPLQQHQQTSLTTHSTTPARMRLLALPSSTLCRQSQPPTINCDIELSSSTASDEDVILDLCNSPDGTASAEGGSASGKRIKILEFHSKNQCKKSSPNSYKNLIKQAEPRTYLCLSRKFNRRHHRYGKSQNGKTMKGSMGGGNVRRRQLILTEQQKQRLRMRKKKLMAIERRKQEAREKKRAAAREKRFEMKRAAEAAAAAAVLAAVKIERIETPSSDEDDDEVEVVKELPNDMEEIVNLIDDTTSDQQTNEALSLATPSKVAAMTQSPKASPKRARPRKQTIAALHLLETIDAVARGYFSDPEMRCSANTPNIFKEAVPTTATTKTTAATTTETATAKNATITSTKLEELKAQMQNLKSSAEKRSKSETKKPIKTVEATTGLVPEPSSMQHEGHTKQIVTALMTNASKATTRTPTTSIQLDECDDVAVTTAATGGVVSDKVTDKNQNYEDDDEEMEQLEILEIHRSHSKKFKSRQRKQTNTRRNKIKSKKSKSKSKTKSKSKQTTTTTAKKNATKSKTAAATQTSITSTGSHRDEKAAHDYATTLQNIDGNKAASPDDEEECMLHEANNNEYEKTITTTASSTTTTTTMNAQATDTNIPLTNEMSAVTAAAVTKPNAITATTIPTTATNKGQQQHSDNHMFLSPTAPLPRVICHPQSQSQPHSHTQQQHHHHHQHNPNNQQQHNSHVAKRSRSRSKFGSRKRQKLKHSTVSFELDDTLPPATRANVVPKWNNGWMWEGEPFQGAVFLNSDDPLVLRTCYPAMRHEEGDIIRTRDCVLLKANEDNELPYVAKVAHLWENPEDGEMMMSLLWYYRPEHTEQGRQRNDSPDEVYASRHRDHNSVACIEDKCYVLTFSEYCRYRRRLRAAEEDIDDVTIIPKRSNYFSIRSTVPDNTNPELVMFCRRAYEFRTKRLLKMPNKHDYHVVNA